jgi:hypothetical protein
MKYVQWCFFIPLVNDEVYGVYEYRHGYTLSLGEQLRLAFLYFINPPVVLQEAKEINQYGTWGFSSGGDAVTGVFLAIIWLGEFVVQALGAVFIPMYRAKRPFSEQANAWYNKAAKVFETDIPENLDSIMNSASSGNVASLAELIRAGRNNGAFFLRFSFLTPPDDFGNEPYYMTVMRFTVDSKNKAQSAKIYDNIVISRSNFAELNAPAPPASDTNNYG